MPGDSLVATAPREVKIPALSATGKYFARAETPLADVSGTPIVALSVVPSLLVNRSMAALRKATVPAREARVTMLREAVELFAMAEIDGLTPERYTYLVSRLSGSPISAIRSAIAGIQTAGESVELTLSAATPKGVSTDWRAPALREGGALWARRGDTLAIHAPGNTPSIHAAWLPALALGYRIAVRPSRRDPLTPHRLISALRLAGWGSDQLVMLPTGFEAADEMIRMADRAIVYGNDDVIAKYASNRNVLLQGPGRAKLLIADDVDWSEHLGGIVRSIQAGGGAYCGNVTGVLVEGDPAPVAEAIAERLRPLPSLPPEDWDSCLPVKSVDAARALESHLLTRAAGARMWLGGDGIIDELGDGSCVVRPAVTELADANDERLNLEMPFPCVWVAPWTRKDGIAPMRNSLQVTAVTNDEQLGEMLVNEPTITNVNFGTVPTSKARPEVPHDDYLASFLMRAMAVKTV